ncbi:hypothetical protein KKA13_01440 [Patescibacteria group bacterium]|nr:hypothetical protein [Patescibacteria group bacterium]MBU1613531.1 hypothetical protein [Patescibacteria group bacterium]
MPEHESERQIFAFREEIKYLQMKFPRDATLANINVDNVSREEYIIWDRYKEILRLLSVEKLNVVKEAKKAQKEIYELISRVYELERNNTMNNEFRYWMKNRLTASKLTIELIVDEKINEDLKIEMVENLMDERNNYIEK